MASTEGFEYSLEAIFLLSYTDVVAWEVIYTDEFGAWWDSLSIDEQASVDRVIGLLIKAGPMLPAPYSSGIVTSQFGGMRELRIQHNGRPYRALYIFDPTRRAVLLLGGDKTGQDRWYEIHVPLADQIYRAYLEELEAENAD